MAAILADPQQLLLVAESPAGQVVAWVQAAVQRLLVSETRAMLTGLVVDEACRGQGLGRQLVVEVERWAIEQGCTAVTVRSNVVRRRAHQFYLDLGYEPVKTQQAFCKKLPGSIE
ncbi:MAG: GNAT family N-acetyltransferase [Chloroflexia bacterium]|nr:GNAT family N-acetyltransferase [Chloroflexia bacterium]